MSGGIMQEQILEYCRKDIKRFSKMSDSEIYDWMCWNFASKDYQMLRRCSTVIFEESRKFR